MRVFNKGRRTYVHHEIALRPGFTDIPAEREESVKVLISRYPNELVEGGAAAGEIAAKNNTIAQQAAEIATLQVQVNKLQKLLTEDPKSNDPKTVANRRADKAEAALAKAMEEIDSLKERLLPKAE